jgi:hypothetical protein
LLFLSGCCSETEVSEQLYYENATQIDMPPVETGDHNGVARERTKSGNTGNRRGVPQDGQKEKGLILDQ